MVSFQCDGCADVVKKPKLDQHRARCDASFTCIDCSKTFPTPVDWKGHTSCISEAEKYQKSLYKPKPNGGGQENPYRNGTGGKFQGQRGSWNKPPPRSQATGANGTPLGTPPRMSPVTAPPLHDEKTRTAVSATAIEPPSKEEPKKHKKRKSEVTNATHVESVTQGADDPILREEPTTKEGKDKTKEKKKKEKKDKHEKGIVLETGSNGDGPLDVSPQLPVDGTGDEKSKKSKKGKKEKKDKHEPATQEASNGVNPAPLSSSSLPPDVAGNENAGKPKKEKKKKKTHTETDVVEAKQDVPVEPPSADVNMVNCDEKKKKKRKSEIPSGEPDAISSSTEKKHKKRKSEIPNGEPDAIDMASMEKKHKKRKSEMGPSGEPDTISSSTEKKHKKRKREAEEQEDVTMQEAATKGKRKKVAVQ